MTLTPPRDPRYYRALRALGLARAAGSHEAAGTDLETLIERYQAAYPDPHRRAWIAARLRAWAGEEER